MHINGTLYYPLKDHLGSASVVTDISGTVVGEQRYYPYGETRLTTGSMFTDKLFTGQREMAGLGIYDYNARFYSPKLARFISADTIVPSAANPQAFNRYSYANNNPVNYTDPSGHMVDSGEGGGCPTCKFPKPNWYTWFAKFFAKKTGGYMSTYAVDGIGVQNPFFPRPDIGKYVVGAYTGLGMSKVTNKEMNTPYGDAIYDDEGSYRGLGLGMSGLKQTKNTTAVQAMTTRIQLRTEACDEKCTSTDIFLAAALGQNGPSFNPSDVELLMHGQDYKPRDYGTHSLQWEKFINSRDTQEKIDFNKNLIGQFASNVLYLQDQGWDIPNDIDWEYVYSLTVTAEQP